jgi:hypothetical protein
VAGLTARLTAVAVRGPSCEIENYRNPDVSGFSVVGLPGFEPGTSSLSGMRSNQAEL